MSLKALEIFLFPLCVNSLTLSSWKVKQISGLISFSWVPLQVEALQAAVWILQARQFFPSSLDSQEYFDCPRQLWVPFPFVEPFASELRSPLHSSRALEIVSQPLNSLRDGPIFFLACKNGLLWKAGNLEGILILIYHKIVHSPN